ncbi:MAG: lipid-binding SYLF domain-containing protein [Prochlorothrix sp.]|nr:lipid-binding SYLF domain-containing protein [Prochlorothrix sp.]
MQTLTRLALPLSVAIATTISATLAPPALADREDGIEKIEAVVEVFEEIMDDRDTRIPRSLIESSVGIAVIPDLAQGGFIIGGKRGKGLLVVRQDDGSWSHPAFLTLTGGSIGLQVGGKSSDVILLFRTQDALENLIDGNFEFGVSASGTAGPVGETALDPAETFGDVLSYSRSSGLFGGVALEGGDLDFDDDRNEDFYDHDDVTAAQIFQGHNLDVPSAVDDLWDFLSLHSSAPSASSIRNASSTSPAPTPTPHSNHHNVDRTTDTADRTLTTESGLSCTATYSKNIGPLDNVRAAKNAARQRIEEACGGLSVYQAEFRMHGPVQESPYVTNTDGSWTFTFTGGTPGWEAAGTRPEVHSVVTVYPNGDVVVDSLELH